jgi:hypothetical protein
MYIILHFGWTGWEHGKCGLARQRGKVIYPKLGLPARPVA